MTKTLEEMAEEYASLGVGTNSIRRRAFLSGAKAAMEMILEGRVFSEGKTRVRCPLTESEIRSLLPTP